MLGDELEDVLEEEATPSYLMPATPNITPGSKVEEDGLGIPMAPMGQKI